MSEAKRKSRMVDDKWKHSICVQLAAVLYPNNSDKQYAAGHYLTHLCCDMAIARIATAASETPNSVSEALCYMENARDNPKDDAKMNRSELFLRSVFRTIAEARDE